MTEVAVASEPQLPALAETPASQTVTADDIELRTVYIAAPLSKAVSNDLVQKGDVYVGAGAEDPDPEIIWSLPAKGKEPAPGVLFYVLGWYKNHSLEVDGSFERWDFGDPDVPKEANLNYNFNLALPEVDPDMPFKMLWTRSKSNAARKVLTVLARGASHAPSYGYAFRFTTELKETNGFKYYVPVVRPVPEIPEFTSVVKGLYDMVGPTVAPSQGPRGDQPSI